MEHRQWPGIERGQMQSDVIPPKTTATHSQRTHLKWNEGGSSGNVYRPGRRTGCQIDFPCTLRLHNLKIIRNA